MDKGVPNKCLVGFPSFGKRPRQYLIHSTAQNGSRNIINDNVEDLSARSVTCL